MTQATITRAQRDTVQELPDAIKDNGVSASAFWTDSYERADLLPAWGTRERERWLRWYDRHNFNTLWQGAVAGLVKKFASTPSQIKGGRNLTAYFDDVLRYADFGAGQRTLKQKVARDYLRFDAGAYVEIIAPGNPKRPPTGRVTGLAHLDSYMCTPTGDPDYPVLYTDRKGKQHLLHRSRVMHLVDIPDGDQNTPGYGLCALSRAIAIVERQILEGRYVAASLDDKPPPGMFLVGGMTKSQWSQRWQEFRQEQQTDERPTWGKVITFHGADATIMPSVTPVPFSVPPEKFDFKVYVELDVHEFALAIGVDIQELWELTGGNLGSAGQSQIQHAKSQGKTYGEMLAAWELGMNNQVLPASLEYEHKVRDPYEAQERATHAQIWTGVAMQLIPLVGKELAAEILANQVEAIADALLDEDGTLIRLPSEDPQATDQQNPDVTVDDSTPTDTVDARQPTTQPNNSPNAQSSKAFDDTRAEFVTNFTDLLGAADELSRRRAGIVLRAQLARLGRMAYEDGLKAGGVTDGMDDSDRATFAVWLAEQSTYVTNFLDTAYGKGLSGAQVIDHAEMWATKSLQGAYYHGVASADRNGMYAFVGDDGEESCATCKSLKGQQHRMGWWVQNQLRPGVDTSRFECGGYRCAHRLERVSKS